MRDVLEYVLNVCQNCGGTGLVVPSKPHPAAGYPWSCPVCLGSGLRVQKEPRPALDDSTVTIKEPVIEIHWVGEEENDTRTD